MLPLYFLVIETKHFSILVRIIAQYYCFKHVHWSIVHHVLTLYLIIYFNQELSRVLVV